jgi:hypothetical protein
MKTQILPNWCKKIGLILFIIGSIISGGDDFIDGYMTSYTKTFHQGSDIFKSYFGANIIHFFSVLSIVALLIYMLAKEKVEDDYINKLRLESYQLASMVILIITILLFSFSESLNLNLEDFITSFMYFYLIIFFIKKRLD